MSITGRLHCNVELSLGAINIAIEKLCKFPRLCSDKVLGKCLFHLFIHLIPSSSNVYLCFTSQRVETSQKLLFGEPKNVSICVIMSKALNSTMAGGRSCTTWLCRDSGIRAPVNHVFMGKLKELSGSMDKLQIALNVFINFCVSDKASARIAGSLTNSKQRPIVRHRPMVHIVIYCARTASLNLWN